MTTLKLSCDDFHGKLSAGLLSMLESEQLVNVTIAVDGRFLKAHKMVLSICSSYFKTLLETNPCKHPIIFMKDVKYHIMKHLLRFMYEGEAQIDAEEFQIFIDTAQALQIKWLTSETNENSENTQKPLLQPELSQQVITSKSTKRPFKPDTKTPESTKPNTFGIVQQEPLIMIHETGSNVTEQIAKRSKILSEHIAIDQPSSSSSIDNLHIHVDNKIGNVVVVNETSIREQMPPSGGISNEGSTSVAEHRIFEHRLNVLQSFDDDSSYRDEISVKEETKDVVDKDGDDDYEDELLDQLPNMSAYLESASTSDVPNMHLPETSTSMQVSTQQEGEPDDMDPKEEARLLKLYEEVDSDEYEDPLFEPNEHSSESGDSEKENETLEETRHAVSKNEGEVDNKEEEWTNTIGIDLVRLKKRLKRRTSENLDNIRHFLEKIPLPLGYQRKSYFLRCKECSANKKRSNTSWRCKTCPSKPSLCVGKCFEEYHTKND